tara:strand:+ start:1575 stop:2513 length:939 start_codon:yes stop_codon:yes gene_type:complete
MPSRKKKGKERVMSSATSLANTPKKRGKTSRLNKGKYAVQGAKYAFENLGKVSKTIGNKAFEYVAPMAEEAYVQGSKMMSEMISNQKVPRVSNNPSWEDLRKGLTTALINIGIINHDEEVPTPIYFQSVERFLDIHKGVMINKGDINIKTKVLEGIHPGNKGDSTPVIMKEYFEKGITHDSIIKTLELVFQDILLPVSDMDLEPEPEPGEGFRLAKEQTMKKQKKSQILNLAKGIEILLGASDPQGYYKDLIKQKFEELNSLITNDNELKVLNNLVKKYPELKDLMGIQGRKKKKTMRRKKKKKQTKRRKKK